jgi:kinesin family protein 2/24
MFMFGQTGSGKTHTMTAIQELAARDLFAGFGSDAVEGPVLSAQFVELRGNRIFDLLAPSISDGRRMGSTRPELRLREQSDGSYAAEGAVELFPKTPEELCTIMQMAQSRRATSATDANSVSSRSHAVCTLRLCESEGQLMLVDCAGTERKKDSMYHSRECQQEGADINSSLHALKECVRYLATNGKVPSHAYRASSLTKVLADAFLRGRSGSTGAQLSVICTASPCATDTEHTISTMRTGVMLAGQGDNAAHEEKQMLMDMIPKKARLLHPKQWSSEQVFEWLATVDNGQLEDIADAIPQNFTGQMLVRLTEGRCVQLCGGSERRGRQLFHLLHQEIQRVDMSRKSTN